MRVFVGYFTTTKLLPVGEISRLCSLEKETSLIHCLWKSMEVLPEAPVKFGV